MILVNLGIYTLALVFIWGLFIVAKIHAYKFKNFSSNILKVTNFLLVFLIILSILGYIIILMGSNNTVIVENYSSFDTKEVNY